MPRRECLPAEGLLHREGARSRPRAGPSSPSRSTAAWSATRARRTASGGRTSASTSGNPAGASATTWCRGTQKEKNAAKIDQTLVFGAASADARKVVITAGGKTYTADAVGTPRNGQAALLRPGDPAQGPQGHRGHSIRRSRQTRRRPDRRPDRSCRATLDPATPRMTGSASSGKRRRLGSSGDGSTSSRELRRQFEHRRPGGPGGGVWAPRGRSSRGRPRVRRRWAVGVRRPAAAGAAAARGA